MTGPAWRQPHILGVLFPQVCDSDTVLDPACTIEMLKILEEDPMVGGVGGDVQVQHIYEYIHVLLLIFGLENNRVTILIL